MGNSIGFLSIMFFFALLACDGSTAHTAYSSVLSEQLTQYCNWRLRGLSNTISNNSQTSRVGKAGPRGSRGPAGRDGRVNYTVVERMVSESLSDSRYIEQLSVLTKKIDRVEGAVIQKKMPRNCYGASESIAKVWNGTGGVFDINPGDSGRAIEVYCDVNTDEGGWIVFQRRRDGSESFERDYHEYVSGFGRNDKEFWLGLEKLHLLTRNRAFELRVDVVDWENNTAYAFYSNFAVGAASSRYTLSVDGYSGTAGDSLTWHNGKGFYTRDSDSGHSDSAKYKGGWWYGAGYHSNLNGNYIMHGNYKSSQPLGVEWYGWRSSHWYSLKYTEMKIREKL